MNASLSLSLAVVMLLASCGKNDPTTIHGSVYDAHTGAPLALVRVVFNVTKGKKTDSNVALTVEEPAAISNPDGTYTAVINTARPDGVEYRVSLLDTNYFVKMFPTPLTGLDFGNDNTVDIPVYPKDAVAEFRVRNSGTDTAAVQLYLHADYADLPALFNWVLRLPPGDSTVASARITGNYEHTLDVNPAGSNVSSQTRTFSVPVGTTGVVNVVL